MCVSEHLSVTPLHCVADMCDVPEKYQFIPEGMSIVSRESVMKILEAGSGLASGGKRM